MTSISGIRRITNWHTIGKGIIWIIRINIRFAVILTDSHGYIVAYRSNFIFGIGLLQQSDEAVQRGHDILLIQDQINANAAVIRYQIILCGIRLPPRIVGRQIGHRHIPVYLQGKSVGIGVAVPKHKARGVGKVHRAGQVAVEIGTGRGGAARSAL